MSDNHHTIMWSVGPGDTLAWLRERGFRAVVCGAPGNVPGVVFSKGNGQTRLALVGDTLVYNGTTVKVENA